MGPIGVESYFKRQLTTRVRAKRVSAEGSSGENNAIRELNISNHLLGTVQLHEEWCNGVGSDWRIIAGYAFSYG